MGHDTVCAHLQYSICEALDIETTENCTHTRARAPKAEYEYEDVTVLWNQELHTDSKVKANGPNKIINKSKE